MATLEAARYTVLPAETLFALLPSLQDIPEVVEALPPSFGRKALSDGSTVVSASQEFRFRNGGYLWVMVSDYGEAPFQLSTELERIRNPAKDYPTQQLELLRPSGGAGYVLWDPTSRSGRLRAVVATRFLLQAEGGDIPARIAWSRLLELFPLQHYHRLVSQQH